MLIKLCLFLIGLITVSIILSLPVYSGIHGMGEECSICHTLHNSDNTELLDEEAINSGEVGCYKCHSSVSGIEAPDTYAEFNFSRSHHPLDDEKECLVCHKMDKQHNDGYLDSWPKLELNDPDPRDSHVYSGAKINNFCLSCHDNSPVELGNPPRTPVDLSSAYEFTGHGRIDINEPCDACHNHHGSLTKPYLIKDVINRSIITGNDNSVCFACHDYTKGSYEGRAAYLSSEHGMRGKLCIDCHNPHGDSKDLCYLCHNDKYSAHYSQKRDKLCVDCHDPHQKDSLKMTKGDEEELCYICHKELKREFEKFSHHKVDDDEYGGGKVECFSCHNVHTITKFNVTDNNSCISCHKTDVRDEMHRVHEDKNYDCQSCHDAHASDGTGGIKRGALLREEITVKSWRVSDKYYEGKNSCSSPALGLGCH